MLDTRRVESVHFAGMKSVSLITGASRGIGRGIATALAAEGSHDLVVNYAGNEAAALECRALCLEAAREKIRVEVFKADVSKAADRGAMLAFVGREFGRLDLLVNNAGVAPEVRADILDAGEESFDRIININLKGPYFLTQQAVKLMGAGGAVVNITSCSATTASVNRGDYCLSKAALSMMTKLYAARLAEFGINVFEIRPGIIATDMTAGVREKYDALFKQGIAPISRWGQPSDVGKAVVAIARGLFPYSTGQVFEVDGGFHIPTL